MAQGSSFGTKQIRNVAVVGHGGSGKTTLIDAACFASGTTTRKGDVNAGTALTMTTPEETGHGMSMQLTVAHAVQGESKINFIDTPGYMDFAGETAAAVRVADCGVVTVGAATGVEVGTELAWRVCDRRSLPRIVFVSMMDKMHASFDRALGELRESLAPGAVPVQLPIGAAADFRGVVDLLTGKAHLHEPDGSGEYREDEVPDDLVDDVEEWATELMETLATTDEELLDRYLEGDEISVEEKLAALAVAVTEGDAVPVFCGAAGQSYGVLELMERLVAIAPHAGASEVEATSEEGEAVQLRAADDESASVLVFKTSTEPHVGELSLFRVYSGMVANGTELRNAARRASERINHLAIPQGRDRVEVEALHAGDIGVVAKLKSTQTNDTLSAPANPVTIAGVEFPQPDISIAVKAAARADEDKLGEALSKLHDEDSDLRGPLQPRAAPDDRTGPWGAAPRRELREDEAQVRRLRRDRGPSNRLSRDDHGRGRRSGTLQEADGRKGPVRRLLGETAASRPGRRLRVRQLDQGWGDSHQVRPLGGPGGYRRRLPRGSWPDIRWSTSRRSATTAPTTPSTPPTSPSRWPVRTRSEP